MTIGRQLSRRTVLKGMGTAIALPFLEAMMPVTALAGRDPTKAPRRLAFVYVPNGIHMPDFQPKKFGPDFELPSTLEPLAHLRNDITIFSGLAHAKANANGDGGGDHARAMATFLTGCQARKTNGADIRIGISADQVAAAEIGHRTRFPSLEVGCEGGKHAGDCDSGYSCAYSNNISWKTESTPMPKEIDPRVIFERLFGNTLGETPEVRARNRKRRASILDYVMEDAQRLERELGAADRRKVDEYLTSVREIETRIMRQESFGDVEIPAGAKPHGIPADYGEHIRLIADLLVLAFKADLTRIATFVIANEGSNRSYPFIEVAEGHHMLSHHAGDKAKQAAIAKINRFHMEQFAYFLTKLKEASEGEGSILDQSMIVYGSGIRDGNRHDHEDLPILVAGSGGGTLPTGNHIKVADKAPANNLWLSLLDRIDATVDRLGDSTGRLRELT